MNVTPIEWTTFSANPLKYRDAAGKVVWGCVRHSDGCRNCYSEALAKRYGRGGPFTVPVMNELTPFLDEAELHKMLTAKTVGGIPVAGSRCFVGDMTDIFGEWVSDELLDRLFAVFGLRLDVTWQVLTKRSDRLRAYLTERTKYMGAIEEAAIAMAGDILGEQLCKRWPLPNVHVGVSCENQEQADTRIPLLLQTPAAVRWVSAEPLLGPIDFTKLQPMRGKTQNDKGLRPLIHFPEWNALRGEMMRDRMGYDVPKLDWIVVGGESGPGARPMHPHWPALIRNQCAAARAPFFFKQWGEWAPGECADDAQTRTERTATWFNDRWTFDTLTPCQSVEPNHDEEPDVYRLGKKHSGRLLDGREWNEYPREAR
jgi:protein gp37